VPAAAVIPAPIAYIKVVAVKKLVVELLTVDLAGFGRFIGCHPLGNLIRSSLVGGRIKHFTLKKLECSRQAIAMNTQAWNNGIGLSVILLVIDWQ
jgi:ABC-type tungstate transport system substrate-binding protein